MMPMIIVHKLKEYDDLLFNQTKLINIRTQALQQKPSRWKAWWEKVQIIVQGIFHEAFESRNVDETLYQYKLALYATTCLVTFIYLFPWVLNS
jgi:urate oxidase